MPEATEAGGGGSGGGLRLLACERRGVADAGAATARLAFLAGVATRLHASLDHRRTGQRVVGQLVPAVADWCAVSLTGADPGPGAVTGATTGARGEDGHAAATSGPPPAPLCPSALGDAARRAVASGATVPVPLPSAPGPGAGAEAGSGPVRALALPLVSRGEVLGALTLAVGGERRYDPEDVALVEDLARTCALALDNARRYGRLQARLQEARSRAGDDPAPAGTRPGEDAGSERAGQLAAVADLGQRALSVGNLDDLMDETVATVAHVLEVPWSAVLETGPGAEGFSVRASVGFDGPALGWTVPGGTGSLAGYTLSWDGPVLVEDFSTETRFPDAVQLGQAGAASGMSAVVRDRTASYGVLVALARGPRAFTPAELSFLQSVANVLGGGVGRHRAEVGLREARERLRLALSAGRMGTWEWDLTTDRVRWSESLEAMLGVPAGGFGPTFEDYLGVVHPDDRERARRTVRRALESGSGYELEERVLRPDGGVRTLSSAGRVLVDDAGRATVMIGVAVDVTERREAETERLRLLRSERAVRSRLEFLAEASEVLSSSLNYRGTLTRLAALAVPTLADWCTVDVVEEGTRPSPVVVHHVDPEKVELARTMRERYPPDPDAPRGVANVIRTGRAEVYPVVTDEMLVASARDEEHLRVLRGLGLRSAMVVPLAARGRTLGALTLVSADPQRAYGHEDLALTEDLARRAAVAIDNARLFQERSEVTHALRQSLLPPELPKVPGLERAWHHRPMSEARIGGDFYDLFETADGSWTVVIGDVQGKGPQAAALTGLVRHTVRAVAVHQRSPSQVLWLVNDAILRHQADRFCTVACGRVEVDDGLVRITLASGGHPLPLLLRNDGRLETVGRPGTLLGIFEDPVLSDHTVELGPGDAVVLFTDGVTEARRDGELFGDNQLAAVLRASAGLDARHIADAVEVAVVAWQPEQRSDDLAVVVLRVAPGE